MVPCIQLSYLLCVIFPSLTLVTQRLQCVAKANGGQYFKTPVCSLNLTVFVWRKKLQFFSASLWNSCICLEGSVDVFYDSVRVLYEVH